MAFLMYPKAVQNIMMVGSTVYMLIQSLLSQGIVKESKSVIHVHVIAHSLGSHIAGVTGHEFYNNKTSLQRISALDPAGPAFYLKDDDDKMKLGKNDAIFVDVVHSNMGQLGTAEMLGHVDFIVNGGVVQPFCKKSQLLDTVKEYLQGL